MKLFLLIAAAWLAVGQMEVDGVAGEGSDVTCDIKYRRVSANHTACLSGDTSSGVSNYNKKYIVQLHNYYRRNVHKYNKQPKAANMQKMYWDEELAMLAQKWASNCLWEHDQSYNRNIPGSYTVGQNLAKRHRSWVSAVRHWQSEVDYFTFGKGKKNNKKIGHYTQMVWAETSRIGCGYARCNRTEPFYVCNYAPSGNFISSQYTPYKAGPKASSCPKTATDSGLCDCKGKVCKNGGKLDVNTCTCECEKKAWINQTDCSLNCDMADESFVCASKGGSWGLETCKKYVNVPVQYCPVTCKLCPGKEEMTPNIDSQSLSMEHGSRKEEQETADVTAVTDSTGYRKWWTTNMQTTAGWLVKERQEANTQLTTKVVPTTPTTSTTSTTPTTPTRSTTSADNDELPGCSMSAEPAKCGQPSAKGYYSPTYCKYGLDHYCPAMCGKCLVRSCMDYEENVYQIGDQWMNEFGIIRCKKNGVAVKRGCYIAKDKAVIVPGKEHKYLDGNITWTCKCDAGYSLSCKGVWTPSGKVRHGV